MCITHFDSISPQRHADRCTLNTLEPHLACRSLDFPIDCPVCKLNSPGADSEDAAAAQPTTEQHLTPRITDRTHREHIMSLVGAVDPHHAMQLHASHSTPSLDTILLSNQGGPEMARRPRQTAAGHLAKPLGSSQHADDDDRAYGFGGNTSKHSAPGINICAKTADIAFASDDPPANAEPDQCGSSQHPVHSASFPIVVTGTPNTPSLIPTEPKAPQGSRLFSPRQPSHTCIPVTHTAESTQTSPSTVSGADLSGSRGGKEEEKRGGFAMMAGPYKAHGRLAGGDLESAEQMSQRSASLGSSPESAEHSCALLVSHSA